jgi:dipeptidase E
MRKDARLAFFSGGDGDTNFDLIKTLLQFIGKKDPLVTFIPACISDAEIEFNLFVRDWSQFGVQRFIHLPIDIPYDEALLQKALTSDLIFLGGGNTFYFLQMLRESGLMKRLEEFACRQGFLAGLSAGAILLTSDIELAARPHFDCDDNFVNLPKKQWKALSLAPFAFFPHYKNSERYRLDLKEYSQDAQKAVLACPDGSGIIMTPEARTYVGKVYQISGRRFTKDVF